jgi:hypothetical protein
VAVVGVLLAAAGLAFFGIRAAGSVLIGALVALGNLWVLARAVKNLLAGGQAKWAGVAFLKFLVLLAVTYGLVKSGVIDPLTLAVGFGSLPLGILVAGTFFAPADPSLVKDTDHA